MRNIILSLLFFISFQNAYSQKIIICADSIQTSLRGLSVVNDDVVWVSGSNGIVGKSTDAGKTWEWITVKGFGKTDFRDIEAFDKNTAIIMGISAPAYLLRTVDGGKTWKVVYENHTKGIFLDAMDFWNDKSGIVVGDPINNDFFIAKTFDGGITWETVRANESHLADSGEACFASSGTNIRKLNKSASIFVSGGLSSHIYIKNKRILLPISQGSQSTGANSIAVKNSQTFVVVGGDFLQKNNKHGNCVFSKDGGKSWEQPLNPPSGYRSCVEFLTGNKWITCGLNGVDISENDGLDWINISKESFHVCRKAKNGKSIYFAGNGGRVGKLMQ